MLFVKKSNTFKGNKNALQAPLNINNTDYVQVKTDE